MTRSRLLAGAGGVLLAVIAARAQPQNSPPRYRNPALSIDARVEDLLGRMTLEEKVGQMNMPRVYEEALGTTVEEKSAACLRFAEGTFERGLGPGGGFFTLANTILPNRAAEQAAYFNRLQRVALEKTRLGIPLLQSEEGTHGLMASDATIFPEGLALGSTWNLDLLSRLYATAAREARAAAFTSSTRWSSSGTATPASGAIRRATAKTRTSARAWRRRSSRPCRAVTCHGRTAWSPDCVTTPDRASR